MVELSSTTEGGRARGPRRLPDTERFKEPGRAIRTGGIETHVPVAECLRDHPSSLAQFLKLLVRGLEDLLSGGAHLAAGGAARVAYPKECRELSQREPELQRATDEKDAVNGVGGIDAVPRRRPHRFGQHTDALIMANRGGAHARGFGDPADRETVHDATIRGT